MNGQSYVVVDVGKSGTRIKIHPEAEVLVGPGAAPELAGAPGGRTLSRRPACRDVLDLGPDVIANPAYRRTPHRATGGATDLTTTAPQEH